jgi:hypothetical protein
VNIVADIIPDLRRTSNLEISGLATEIIYKIVELDIYNKVGGESMRLRTNLLIAICELKY